MANTKEYKIVINGITESVNAVKSLEKELSNLEERIKALEAKSINIKGGSSTGGGGSSRTSNASSLSEEEKLLKSIETTEKKIETYSKGVYQNYLAAKDTLKETLNDQKQIAATERLQANNYTNTMAGLKSKLADIKQVMQTTDIGSDIFKKYTAEANEITNKLKELEEAYGQFGRNVGNYKSAADGFKKLEIEVNGVVRSFDNARQAYKTLKNERDTMALMGQRETKQFKELDETVKTLASDIKDMAKSSVMMDNILDTMQSFTAMAGIGVGLTQLFGIDDATFSDSMKKLTSLLLIVKSFETLASQWQSNEGIMGKIFKPISEKLDSWAEKKGEDAVKKYIEGLIKKAGSSKDDLREALSKIGTDNEDFLISDMLLSRELKGEFSTEEEYKKAFDKLKETFAGLTKEEKAALYVTEMLNVRIETFGNRTKKVFGFVTGAAKVLSKVLLTLGGIFATLLASEVLDMIGNFVKTLNSAKVESDRAEESMKALNRQFEEQKNIISSNYLKGAITDEKYLSQMFKEQTRLLAEQISLLKARSKELEDRGLWGTGLFKQTENTEYSGERFSEGSEKEIRSGYILQLKNVVKSVKEVEDEWKKCNKAIKDGKDYLDKYSSGIGSWFVTLKDTEEIMRGLGNIKLSDFVAQFGELNQKAKENKISAEQYAKELRKLKQEMNANEVLNSVIANLDKYIPDEGVRERVQSIINEIARLDDAFNMTSPQQIHHWEQVRIDGMKDGWEKTKAQIKENQRYELQQEGHTAKQKELIQAKYRRQYLDAQEKFGKEAADKAKEIAKKQQEADNQLIALRIANMKDGFDKRMKELDNQKRLELQKLKNDAKDNKYIEVQEMTLEINKKYDKLILDEKRKWAYDTLKTYEDLAERISQLNKATFDIETSTASQNVDNRTRRGQSETGYQMITPTNYDDSKNLEEYYRKIVDIKKKAAEREFAIEQKRLDKQLDFDKKEEELRHKRLIDENGGEYITQLRAGLISQEKYDKLIEDENDAHYARMNALDKQYASNLSAATEDSLEKTQKLYSDFYGNVINNLRRDKSKVDEIVNKQPVTDTAGWGVVNMGKTSQNYTNALAEYDKIKQEILKKQTELEQDLKNNSISAEDFAIRQEDLKNEIKAIDESCKSVKESQKMLVADFIQSIDQYIQAVVGNFNQIMQAVWNAQDTQMDKEAEQLDEMNKILADKLSKQQEIVEQHKSKIDSIEDELATARGDRRQHLIDQLNAEMRAQREAAAQEKKLQKQKEANERKQDDLEKERKKQQYKRDMLQAVVNGAMAVTYALVNKWPIPALPMAALAASTAAAQIGIMAANKPYAKGGLLEGPSHAQGGIPVGNTGIEVEGKEYVIRKSSTAPNIEVLDYINKSERKLNLDDFIQFYSSGNIKKTISSMSPRSKFADGGVVPTLNTNIDINDRLLTAFDAYSNRPVVVSVQDINTRQKAVRNVQVLAGLE